VPARTAAELQQRIERILADTRLPGATLVVTDREKPLVLAGFGKADLATGRPVTPETLFRLGSTSKVFVALAVLKLVEEGRLQLQAPVRSVLPEGRFENPWESTDPVRVVHLLEHTSGWNEISFKEYAHNDAKPVTLAEGLALGSASRKSRWRPGTRYSYCNAGPAVAAAIVERVAGQRFEDYVEAHFFKPLGMSTADYFLSPRSAAILTQLYRSDGQTPIPFHHICLRPSGAVLASAADMGACLRLFLNRGRVGSRVILPEHALRRMETPTTYWGAQAGLATGYGLNNYTTLDDRGFVWHGHDGGMEGSQTEMAYLPDQGIGYFFSINTRSPKSLGAISREVQAFATKDLARPTLPRAQPVSRPVQDEYGGWYHPDSPRMQIMSGFERLRGLVRCRFEAGRLHWTQPLLGLSRTYVAVTDRTFRVETRGAATLAVMATEDGRIVQTSGATFSRVPSALAYVEILLTGSFLLAVTSVPLFALVWGARWLLGRMKEVPPARPAVAGGLVSGRDRG